MHKEISRWALFWVIAAFFASQIPSIYFFHKLSQIYDALNKARVEIMPTKYPSQDEIDFIEHLKENSDFTKEIRIVIGPYKKLFENSEFRYRLEKHLVFVEPPNTTKETFLILFDKGFYDGLDGEMRKGVLAHEASHIFNHTNGLIRIDVTEELEADRFATSYVSVQTMIALCKKYEGDEIMRHLRIKNLQRIAALRPKEVS